jgi:hypothetical protein
MLCAEATFCHPSSTEVAGIQHVRHRRVSGNDMLVARFSWFDPMQPSPAVDRQVAGDGKRKSTPSVLSSGRAPEPGMTVLARPKKLRRPFRRCCPAPLCNLQNDDHALRAIGRLDLQGRTSKVAGTRTAGGQTAKYSPRANVFCSCSNFRRRSVLVGCTRWMEKESGVDPGANPRWTLPEHPVDPTAGAAASFSTVRQCCTGWDGNKRKSSKPKTATL